MATGLDVATGVAGLISLSITLFQGCVSAIQIISDARHAGKSVDNVSCLLEWEEYRLLQWGEKVGLLEENPQDHRIKWDLIERLLRELHELLTDAKSIRVRYSLEPCDTSTSTSRRHPASPEANFQNRKNHGLRTFWQNATPKMKSSRAQIAKQKASNTIKKLRWASLDQEKANRLLADVSKYNNCLQQLLDSSEQLFVRRALAALFRDTLSRSSTSTEIAMLRVLLDEEAILNASDIGAAASLKQSRLLLGFDRRPDEHTTATQATSSQTSSKTFAKTKISQLNYLSLTRSSGLTINLDKEVAIYKGGKWNVHSSVLVEWKYVKKLHDAALQKRIKSLAFLMSHLDGASFHSLKSIGFLKYELPDDQNLYAYVFEIVDLTNDPAPESVPQLRALSALFGSNRLPSLTERRRIALAVAETLLQLHTAGWLHKAISAQNILFVDRGSMTWESGSGRGPFVSGYEFSRNVHADTEGMPVKLCQHPQVGHGVFKKVFDLYALGCVMLELSHWQALEDILHSCGGKDERTMRADEVNDTEAQVRSKKIMCGKAMLEDRPKFTSVVLEAAAHKGGDIMKEVIDLCFFPDDTCSTNDDEEVEDILETSVRTQIRIVDLLRSMKV